MDNNDSLTGFRLINSAANNKGTAFSKEERETYKLRGLLPPRVGSLELQLERCLKNLRRYQNDIEKYVFLSALQARTERLFYRLVIDNIEEVMPLIYTPTVGQACKEYAHISSVVQEECISLLKIRVKSNMS